MHDNEILRDEHMNEIGERLKQSRKQVGLSQVELANITGLTKAAVGQIESGITKSPRPENLFKLSRALRVDPEWLITGKTTKEVDAAIDEKRLKVERLTDKLSLMSEEEIKPFGELIDLILSRRAR